MIRDFSNYKFRCSALGKIMSAKGELTQGNKTYLKELFTEIMEGKRKEITSRYFEKGVFMEEDGVSMINDTLYPNDLLMKNKERKENDYIHGECDLLHDGIVYDIKNAWDVFTFGKADLTDDYEWQGRGYMWLWGANKFRLFYCLNNMPEHMLIDEEKRLFYRHSFVSIEDAEYQKLCLELRAFHNYDRKPVEEKFKIWEIKHSEAEIQKLKDKIKKARAYLNELLAERYEQINFNRKLMSLPSVMFASRDESVKATIVQDEKALAI